MSVLTFFAASDSLIYYFSIGAAEYDNREGNFLQSQR